LYRINSASLTDVGIKRQNNEDYVAFFEPQDATALVQSGCLYIVADGVGGAAKGERASQFAAQSVLYDYYRNASQPVGERLSLAMRQANAQIYHFAEQGQEGRMATTMVAAVIRNNTLAIANVGDSRAYLLRDGAATQITHDHSMVGEMVREGVMTEAEAQHSSMKNRLLRSLGGESDVHVDLYPEISLLPGDKIILCSDGLTSYALGEDILRLSEGGSPSEIVSRMVKFARNGGGADNISVIAVLIGEEDDSPTLTWRGQKPAPVDWNDIPTDKFKPVRVTKASQKGQKGLPRFVYWVLAIGILGTLSLATAVGLLAATGKINLPFGPASQPTTLDSQSTQPLPTFDPQSGLPAATSPGEICLYQVHSGDSFDIIRIRFGSDAGPSNYTAWTCADGPSGCENPVPLTTSEDVVEGMWLEIPGTGECQVGGGVLYRK
jgi:protein phosphatase